MNVLCFRQKLTPLQPFTVLLSNHPTFYSKLTRSLPPLYFKFYPSYPLSHYEHQVGMSVMETLKAQSEEEIVVVSDVLVAIKLFLEEVN